MKKKYTNNKLGWYSLISAFVIGFISISLLLSSIVTDKTIPKYEGRELVPFDLERTLYVLARNTKKHGCDDTVKTIFGIYINRELNIIHCNSDSTYVINGKVYPKPKTLSKFLKDLNVTSIKDIEQPVRQL